MSDNPIEIFIAKFGDEVAAKQSLDNTRKQFRGIP